MGSQPKYATVASTHRKVRADAAPPNPMLMPIIAGAVATMATSVIPFAAFSPVVLTVLSGGAIERGFRFRRWRHAVDIAPIVISETDEKK